jgi:hypothetical protein
LRIKRRWQMELPRPVRNPIPIHRRRRAGHAAGGATRNIWNGFGPTPRFKQNEGADRWCAEVGRNPAIERSVMTPAVPRARSIPVEASASHIIMNLRSV